MDNTPNLTQEINELKESINELKDEVRSLKEEKEQKKKSFDIGDNLGFVAILIFVVAIMYITR
ncbi:MULTISPECIES: hypothetical protein [unclassified Bacillus (in: firmicutes)]|uniref:hypothetical protein n=1 Tax=unclassified Bacillus (in: firmicutes) TaxID=185979 RepID=UPI0008F04B55|nr:MULTISPECIES: hypothetical protein [unclassified Bacillus (in: firmicutes)]SFJ97237.1 hypothetical protein SAMN04488574_1395 [Bacillus sp. 71mf]SFT17433.1 hypothetical protein SAMN04488145_11631 [Bacillus sp. 103mf]